MTNLIQPVNCLSTWAASGEPVCYRQAGLAPRRSAPDSSSDEVWLAWHHHVLRFLVRMYVQIVMSVQGRAIVWCTLAGRLRDMVLNHKRLFGIRLSRQARARGGAPAIRSVARRIARDRIGAGASSESVANGLQMSARTDRHTLYDSCDTRNSGDLATTAGDVSVRRVNVNFALDTYCALLRIAARKHDSMPEALRQSITLTDYIETTIEVGGRVLIDRDGQVNELIIR